MNFQQNADVEKILHGQIKVETIRELAKRHLMDPNHTTTDEELANAQVEFDLYTLPERRVTEVYKSKQLR